MQSSDQSATAEQKPLETLDPAPVSNLIRLVQSTAYSVECPGAVFFKEGECGFRTVASFGFTALETVRGNRILDEARHLRVDGVMIVNDVTRQPGYTAQDGQLFDMVTPVALVGFRGGEEHVT